MAEAAVHIDFADEHVVIEDGRGCHLDTVEASARSVCLLAHTTLVGNLHRRECGAIGKGNGLDGAHRCGKRNGAQMYAVEEGAPSNGDK